MEAEIECSFTEELQEPDECRLTTGDYDERADESDGEENGGDDCEKVTYEPESVEEATPTKRPLRHSTLASPSWERETQSLSEAWYPHESRAPS